ncbi:hypothetical protein ACFL9U_18125, partial [Thermodesulfobacteriota bacterium]
MKRLFKFICWLAFLFYLASSYFPDTEKEGKILPKRGAGKSSHIPLAEHEKRDEYDNIYRTYDFASDRRTQYKIEHAISREIAEETEASFGYSPNELFELLSENTQDFNDQHI